MIFDLDTKGQADLAAEAKANPLGADRVAPSTFTGTFTGMGMGIARGGVRSAQGLTLAGSVAPMVADKLAGSDNKGESLTDSYFRSMVDPLNDAVDYWTPKPTEVGKAGQVLGGLGEVVLPLMLGGGNPTLMAASVSASQTAGTGADLVKAGVDGKTAGIAAAAQGLSAAAGFAIPFMGTTLATRMASGVGGNLITNMAGTAVAGAELNRAGFKEQAKQFDALDPTARTIDILTGAIFGGVAHLGARSPAAQIKPSDVDAVLTAANAKHFQHDTAPGDPLDANSSVMHQKALETAVAQLARGERVNIADSISAAEFVRRPPSPIAQSVIDAYAPPPVAASVAEPKPTAIQATAQRLGVSAQDLAAVISYETGGSMSPSILGGKGGKYLGLIQFGPAEAAKYGANSKQTFDEQLQAVEAYLKDRGLPQGADLATIYRTVNGGNPKAGLNLSDGNGTIAQHIAKIQRDHATRFAGINQEMDATARAAQQPQAVADLESSIIAQQTLPPKPTLADSDIRAVFADMANETGWAEIGGKILRDPVTNEVNARTSWIPKAEWWPDRPKGLTEAEANKAIQKALNGEPLRVPEQRLVDYMTDYANERFIKPLREISEEDRARINAELAAEDLPAHPVNVADVNDVARAIEINADAVERLSIMHQNDDAAFQRSIKEIINEQKRQQDASSKAGGSGEAPQQRQAASATKQADSPLTIAPAKVTLPRAESALPKTPEIESARQAAEANPDARVALDDGTEVSAHEAMLLADHDLKQADTDRHAFMAAITCFLRS